MTAAAFEQAAFCADGKKAISRFKARFRWEPGMIGHLEA
jgi:hypothetical protein